MSQRSHKCLCNIVLMKTITTFEALSMMRKLTKIGVPFSFTFSTYSSTKKQTNGVRHVERALLRTGLRKDQSDKSETLIAFTEYPSGEAKFFHLALLISFNGYEIKNT